MTNLQFDTAIKIIVIIIAIKYGESRAAKWGMDYNEYKNIFPSWR